MTTVAPKRSPSPDDELPRGIYLTPSSALPAQLWIDRPLANAESSWIAIVCQRVHPVLHPLTPPHVAACQEALLATVPGSARIPRLAPRKATPDMAKFLAISGGTLPDAEDLVDTAYRNEIRDGVARVHAALEASRSEAAPHQVDSLKQPTQFTTGGPIEASHSAAFGTEPDSVPNAISRFSLRSEAGAESESPQGWGDGAFKEDESGGGAP